MPKIRAACANLQTVHTEPPKPNMQLKPISIQEDKTKPEYASPECQQLLSMYEQFYPTIGFHLPWVGYFIISDNTIVGSCGFVGQPQHGKVEMAYWTFQPYEGKGIASFACKELIEIARKSDPGLTICAKTAPEKNASTRILEKNHFKFSEVVQDEETGDAWLWVLRA